MINHFNLHSNIQAHTFDVNDGGVITRDKKFILDKKLELKLNKLNINPSQIWYCQQNHGSKVAILKNTNTTHILSDVDGIISNIKNIYLAVRHADCAPIFLFDPKHQVIGLLHSGWRGSCQKIIQNGLKIMINDFNCDVRNIHIKIGPCAHQCCYGFDLQMPHSILLQNKEWNLYINQNNSKQYFINMLGFIKQSAISMGVKASLISSSRMCTICDGRYFSYRRQCKTGAKIKNGLSIIALR